MREKLKNKDGG